MFRSSVTISILALAVAFLVQIVTFELLSQATQRTAHRELGQRRELGELITRLTSADTRAAVLLELDRGSPERLAEYRRWSGSSPAEFAAAQKTAQALCRVGAYLKRLPPAAQAVLLGDLTAEELYERLQSEAAFSAFRNQIASLRVRLPTGDVASFQQVVQVDRKQLTQLVTAIIAGHQRAIAQVRQAYPDRSPAQLAAQPPADFSEVLSQAGFSVKADWIPALRRFGTRAWTTADERLEPGTDHRCRARTPPCPRA